MYDQPVQSHKCQPQKRRRQPTVRTTSFEVRTLDTCHKNLCNNDLSIWLRKRSFTTSNNKDKTSLRILQLGWN